MGATAIQVIHPQARRFVARHAVAQLILWSGFYYLMPALLPAMLAETGWSAIAVSGAITAGFLLWAMLCPLADNVVDRGNFGVAMRVAGAVGAAQLLIAASTQSMAVACASLLLLGGPMAMTLYDPCFSVMIRRFGPGAQLRRAITSVTLVELVVQGAGYGVHTILRPVLSAEWLPETGFSRRLGVIAMTGLLMMAVAPLVGVWRQPRMALQLCWRWCCLRIWRAWWC